MDAIRQHKTRLLRVDGGHMKFLYELLNNASYYIKFKIDTKLTRKKRKLIKENLKLHEIFMHKQKRLKSHEHFRRFILHTLNLHF